MRYFIVVCIAFYIFPAFLSAERVHYGDVLPEAWFYHEVTQFLDQGYLDVSQTAFRPSDAASRAEFLKLIVELNGGILDEIPTIPSFSDVAVNDWFIPFIEEAARESWVRGDGNCYKGASFTSFVAPSGLAQDIPSHRIPAGAQHDICNIRPYDPISRAEAAVIMHRAFGKQGIGRAPAFADNPAGSWFSEAVHIAADHCIMRGDDGTRNVRPGDSLNRAEMVVMLYRVDHGGLYPDC